LEQKLTRVLRRLDDAALIAAIPKAGISAGPILCAEVGRRRLSVAVPTLEEYCRRFAGFGTRHPLQEQNAALDALAAISTPDAAAAVSRVIARGWVQGPSLQHALETQAAFAKVDRRHGENAEPPPREFAFLLACLTRPGRADEQLGDAEKEFRQMIVRLSVKRARWRYRAYVLHVVASNALGLLMRFWMLKKLFGI
jgi:hypothetical protein